MSAFLKEHGTFLEEKAIECDDTRRALHRFREAHKLKKDRSLHPDERKAHSMNAAGNKAILDRKISQG